MSLRIPQPNAQECNWILRRILFCPSQERTVRELDAMDSEARKKVWSDMTGYATAMEYILPTVTQELLNRKLQELNSFLQQPGLTERDAFDIAVKQNHKWMEQEKLKFLRAFDFNIATTADHMVRCFTLKEELFGRDKLAQDIQLVDLNEEDLLSLYAEPLHFLPHKDNAGRMVAFIRPSEYVYKNRYNMLRAAWYQLHATVQDEICRQAGYVCVAYEIDSTPTMMNAQFDFELIRQLMHMQRVIPFQVCSLYICFSSPAWEAVMDIACHLMSLRGRVRSRTIQGSPQECLYQLMALGIPVKAFPISPNGDPLPRSSREWIERQWQREKSSSCV